MRRAPRWRHFVAALRGALCAAGRGHRAASARRGRSRSGGRAADRRAGHAPGAGDPGQIRRARRDRGLPARILAVHQGGPRPHGAGRSAAAGARCRHGRPADRGQARGRRLGRTTSRNPPPSWSRPRPGRSASAPASSSRARRRRTSWRAWASGSACRRCAAPPARRCGCSARTSCWGRRSRRRSRARRRSGPRATRSTCWARARAPPRMRSAISTAYADAIEAIGRCAATRPLPTGPASRSSCRRCIRATRRSRASACCASSPRGSSSSPARPRRTTSTSPSMPRRPTGSSCRSR